MAEADEFDKLVPDSQAGEPRKITFHYIKSNSFRIIHVEGAIGSINPRLNIHMAIWNERASIPTKSVFPIVGDAIGEEIRNERESKGGLVREIEADLVFDLESAKKLSAWLTTKIAEVEEIMKSISSSTTTSPTAAP